MTSVYELTTPLGKVRKQRFWDYFDGNGLRNWWREQNIVGTATFAMSDNINEGFSITTDTTNNSRNEIDFNDIRQFDNTASVCIWESRRVTASNSAWSAGLVSTDVNQAQRARWEDAASITWKRVVTTDATTTTNTDSTVAVDTNWTTYKQQLSSSNIRGWLNGTFELVNTSNLPTVKLQPAWASISVGTNSIETRSRYVECYNT